MSKYTFTVRKQDFEISLTTSDRDAIEQQVAIWVMATNRKPLIQTMQPEEYVMPPIKEELEINNTSQEIVEEVQASDDEKQSINVSSEPSTFVEEKEPSIKPFEPIRIEHSTPEIVTNETRQEYVEEFINNIEPEEKIEQIIEPPIKDEVISRPHLAEKNPEIGVTLNSLFNAENPTTVDFESILEKTVDNSGLDTINVIKKDENFCKLVKANNITDRLELLLFTADYFCKYDAKFTFSLKQINGKLMNNLAVIVDHGILKIALDNNYIEQIGDSEYRLTEYGRSEIYSKAGIWS